MVHLKLIFDQCLTFLKSLNKTRRKQLTQLREQWGRPVDRFRDFPFIAQYHQLVKDQKNEKVNVDDKTWLDLNFDAIFEKIDRTISNIGSQFLFHRLRTYERDPNELIRRSKCFHLFQEDNSLREKIQLILLKLKNSKCGFITPLIFGQIPERPRIYPLIYLSSIVTVISTIMISMYPPFLYAFIPLAILNIFLNKIYGKNAYIFFTGLMYLNILLGMVTELAKLSSKNNPNIREMAALKHQKKFAERLQKKVGWLVIDKSKMNELAQAFIEYLNLICLFDLVAFTRSINDLKKHQPEIQEIFNSIAALDAYIAIASYISQYAVVTPQFQAENFMQFKSIYHPLLQEPVANNFYLKDQSCLITGSNMAGKTTFIKTIGVNFILAQTLCFCHAEEAKFSPKIIKSSIQRGDQIIEGKSYYLVEVEALLEFIHLSGESPHYLFLIDEIYRGTNTVERIAAATSVLKHIGRQNVALVTTHDIELQDLLAGIYQMYHFSEQVEDGNYFFDYQIKSGPCASRNAIKLLEISGYPKTVVENALHLAQRFSVKSIL